ncbi:hypothetical protein PDR5_22680 [Pseudomonas sp. DR 5-09]|nr:hypothetical protein PDR5_22680 [Pseudomonas sp. DR 5-09]
MLCVSDGLIVPLASNMRKAIVAMVNIDGIDGWTGAALTSG